MTDFRDIVGDSLYPVSTHPTDEVDGGDTASHPELKVGARLRSGEFALSFALSLYSGG